ncbi:MAG: beta-lactamase family protein [Bacteroides sp.]|nr:beta-lactamase family protein [Bacteroides sp.]MCM1095148.1 beta-lactamase family protein [Terasakiella sp.]
MKLLHTLAALLLPAAASAFDCSEIDSIVDARYSADAPGAAIIIARGDSVLYERYVGLADMDTREPVSADTRFCIASISKQFTVMALLQQDARYAEPGGLLDSPVSRWFDFPQQWWAGITLRHLASHTSGVPDSRPRHDRRACVLATDEESVRYFPAVDSLRFAPGEYYDYLNPSFILLAQVVERLSGRDFVGYMQDSVFAPAGMSHTYYFDPARRGPGESHGYVPDGRGGWQEYDYGEETFFATRPDGGIYSTARDLLAWEDALRDGRVASPRRVSLAYTPVVSVSASPLCDYQRYPDTWYGLGYFIDHPAGWPRKIYHTGDNGGYQAYLAKYPAEDVKIIVLEARNDRSRREFAECIDRALGLRVATTNR